MGNLAHFSVEDFVLKLSFFGGRERVSVAAKLVKHNSERPDI